MLLSLVSSLVVGKMVFVSPLPVDLELFWCWNGESGNFKECVDMCGRMLLFLSVSALVLVWTCETID